MTLMAVDPGETIGVAMRRDTGELFVCTATSKEQLWKAIVRCCSEKDIVIVEDFITAGRISKHGLYTVRLVGSLEALAWRRRMTLVKQVPGYRNSMLEPARRAMPVGSKHEHRHEKDALAHLLMYERDKERTPDSGNGSYSYPKVVVKQARAVRTSIEELR